MIKAVEAGPELDARVAVDVMGWKPPPCLIPNSRDGCWKPLMGSAPQMRRHFCTGKMVLGLDLLKDSHWKTPDGDYCHSPEEFSTDWAAAGEVLEKMQSFDPEYPWRVKLESDGSDWRCDIRDDPLNILGYNRANTGPLAICLAALEAVGGQDNA